MNRSKYMLVAMGALIVLAGAVSLGNTFFSPQTFWKMVIGQADATQLKIVLMLRLPRILMASIIGASLAVSGTLFQAILKNPLADPFTIGVSSGASLGAAVGIVLSQNSFVITSGALIGSMCAASFIFMLSKRKRFGSSALVLSGISLGFILWSSVLLIFALSPAQKVHKALLWLMGDLSIARYGMLWKAAPFICLVIGLTYIYYRQLNIISFGNEFAHSMGVSSQEVKNIFWIAAVLAAVSVSLAGIIGFVGLIVPHVTRSLCGPDHKKVLGLAAGIGALFLIFCDTVSRSIAAPYEIPIGVITGFIGGLFFIVLMLRRGEAV